MRQQAVADGLAMEGRGKSRIEARSIDYVPLAERRGKAWHLWPVWFTGDANLATIACGAIGVSMGGNLLWSAIAVLIGNLLGTFFMAFHSSQGPQLGLPQMIQSRPQFGYMGALLVWIVALVTYVGYNSFNQLMAGQTAHHLLGTEPHVSYIVFTAIAVALAIFGYDLIHKAQRWLAIALLVALSVFSVGICVKVPFPAEQLSFAGFKATPFLVQLFAAAAYQLSWSIYVSDYSRYLPPTTGVRATFWWTFTGALIGGAWMMLVGTAAAALNSKIEIADAVQRAGDAIHPGFGSVTLLLSLLGLLAITGLNFYGASLTLLSITDSFRPLKSSAGKRVVSLLIVAVVATSLAFAASDDFMGKFGDFLGILGYLFTPWTAINLVDFFFVRHTHYSVREIFNPRGIYGRWNWRGLTAYAVGFVAMIPFFKTETYSGPVARALGGTDIAMLVGLPVAALVYLWACRSLDTEAERKLVEAADRGLN
ncbi:cytosine permease [Burkholderia multivorans]|uniref:purine-cytosine permease family protein n=1 Tax=Burkholderia multivorans TaxID=87883 RepID=UPI002019D573|nr:cytosine permease [Burkholderia multivorans]UQN71356.1 cytosine permease [Burkholderia multivorans]UQN76852.1 cytosine permease [Burkholderia multivorans]